MCTAGDGYRYRAKTLDSLPVENLTEDKPAKENLEKKTKCQGRKTTQRVKFKVEVIWAEGHSCYMLFFRAEWS